MRVLIAMLSIAAFVAACSGGDATPRPYGATSVKMGESQSLLGWNISMSNLRWQSDHVLVDVDGSAVQPGKPHAKAADLRFGLYGAVAHPIEATGLGSCRDVTSLAIQPLAAPSPDRLTGTVCIGPLKDQSSVRGIYAYSPQDRIPGTTVAYPLAFPVGLPPTNPSDTGLRIDTTTVAAWRSDGLQLDVSSLGDPGVFTGNGYMLVGVEVSGLAEQYRDDSAKRGGPMMVLVTPTLPNGSDLSRACAAYGASMLVLPDAKLDAVHVTGSVCTQGEINEALLYATLSVVGTHAAVWINRG